MYYLTVTVLTLAITMSGLSYKLPDPGDLALVLSENEFEDYLDDWLAVEQEKIMNASSILPIRGGCNIRVNGHLPQPQPVYIRKRTNTYLDSHMNTGFIHLETGEELTVSCPGKGRSISHPLLYYTHHTVDLQCIKDTIVLGLGWLEDVSSFEDITCSSNAYYDAIATGETCYHNATVIKTGFVVNQVFYPLYTSCFNQNRYEVLYVEYKQDATNAVHQTGVARPSWRATTFFSGVSINNLYKQATQKASIAELVGAELADVYITGKQYLARGHLSAKTDYIFATGQRASFLFINAAPQWQPFNAGNWNWLEQNLRKRIGEAKYDTVVYTGTFGVAQLKDPNGHFIDIYLNGDSVPVPLYFYKVVYDASRRLGTAFISINNPYYTLQEARAMQFCTDRCRNNAAFNWLNWQPDRIDIGYSFCCTIDDFRRRVPHLPEMIVYGLLS